MLQHAHTTARDYYPDIWENITGRKLKPGQSEKRDQENYLLEHSGNLITGTGWGSWAPWVPKGMVGVAAYPAQAFLGPTPAPARTHDARFFLVPEKEYRAGHFVVDPARHQEVTGKPGVPPSICEDKKRANAERLKNDFKAREQGRKDNDHER